MRGCFAIIVAAGCGRLAFDPTSPPLEVDAPGPDGPPRPLLVSGQAADLVLGQPDFTATATGTITAQTLNRPEGIATDGTQLWVHDNGHARILRWSTLPAASQQAADGVLGQTDFTSMTTGLSQTAFTPNANAWEFDGSFTDGQRLYVTHHNGGRVMIWDPLPTAPGAPMQLVLGADNFTTCCSTNPAARFGDPTGLWTDGNQLIIADIHAHRVMIWPTHPTGNGQPASLVLGRPDFTIVSSPTQPPTAATLSNPHGVQVSNGRLFVADSGNNRVLVWNQIPTQSGTPADFAIGQPNLTTNTAGTGAAGLDFPAHVLVIDDYLLIADPGNNRIVIYHPVPTAAGASAVAVLGQSSLDARDLMPPPAADRFRRPVSMAVAGDVLFVSDIDNNRVLRFTLGR